MELIIDVSIAIPWKIEILRIHGYWAFKIRNTVLVYTYRGDIYEII